MVRSLHKNLSTKSRPTYKHSPQPLQYRRLPRLRRCPALFRRCRRPNLPWRHGNRRPGKAPKATLRAAIEGKAVHRSDPAAMCPSPSVVWNGSPSRDGASAGFGGRGRGGLPQIMGMYYEPGCGRAARGCAACLHGCSVFSGGGGWAHVRQGPPTFASVGRHTMSAGWPFMAARRCPCEHVCQLATHHEGLMRGKDRHAFAIIERPWFSSLLTPAALPATRGASPSWLAGRGGAGSITRRGATESLVRPTILAEVL